MGTSIRELFPTLTRVTCDCCGETFVDEAGLLMVEDAIVSFRDALVAKHEKDKAAWSDAFALADQALAEARGAGG